MYSIIVHNITSSLLWIAVEMDCEQLFAESDDDVEVLPTPSNSDPALKSPIQNAPCNLSTPSDASSDFTFGIPIQPNGERRYPFVSSPENRLLDYLVVRNDVCPTTVTSTFPSPSIPHRPTIRLDVGDMNARYQPKSDAHYFPPLTDYLGDSDVNPGYGLAFNDNNSDPWMNSTQRLNRNNIDYQPFLGRGRHKVSLPYHNENILNLSNNSRLRDPAGDLSGPSNYTNYLNRNNLRDSFNKDVHASGSSSALVENPSEILSPPIEVSSGEEDNNLVLKKRIVCDRNKKISAKGRRNSKALERSTTVATAPEVKTEDGEPSATQRDDSLPLNFKSEHGNIKSFVNIHFPRSHYPHDHNVHYPTNCPERPCKCQKCFPSLPSTSRNIRSTSDGGDTRSRPPHNHSPHKTVKYDYRSKHCCNCHGDYLFFHHCRSKEEPGNCTNDTCHRNCHQRNEHSLENPVAGTSHSAPSTSCPTHNHHCPSSASHTERDTSNIEPPQSSQNLSLTAGTIKIEINCETVAPIKVETITQTATSVKKECIETCPPTCPESGVASNVVDSTNSVELPDEAMDVDVKAEVKSEAVMSFISSTVKNEQGFSLDVPSSSIGLNESMEAIPGTSRELDANHTCDRKCMNRVCLSQMLLQSGCYLCFLLNALIQLLYFYLFS